MSFEPINKEHAIADVSFGLKLGRILSNAEITEIYALHHLIKEILPAKEYTETIQYAQLNGRQAPRKVAAVMFASVLRDGTPEWQFTAQGDEIIITCTRYTRWAYAFPQALDLISRVIESILTKSPTEDTRFKSVSLQVVDEFHFMGTEDKGEYKLDELFSTSSPYLTNIIVEQGPLWHLHQGWFKSANKGKILTQLNLDGIYLDEHGKSAVRISSNRAFFPDDDLTLLSGLSAERITEMYSTMHAMDKDVLRALLNSEVRKRISLDAAPLTLPRKEG